MKEQSETATSSGDVTRKILGRTRLVSNWRIFVILLVVCVIILVTTDNVITRSRVFKEYGIFSLRPAHTVQFHAESRPQTGVHSSSPSSSISSTDSTPRSKLRDLFDKELLGKNTEGRKKYAEKKKSYTLLVDTLLEQPTSASSPSVSVTSPALTSSEWQTMEKDKEDSLLPHWLPLDKNNQHLFVYSAYYDDVDEVPFVRVLASGRGYQSFPVVCIYYNKGDYSHDFGSVQGEFHSYLVETRNMYEGAYIVCPLLTHNHRPHGVSVFKMNSSIAQNRNYISIRTNILLVTDSGYTRLRENPKPNDGPPQSEEQNKLQTNPSARTLKNDTNYQSSYSKVDEQSRHREFPENKPKWNIIKCLPAFHSYTDVMNVIQQVEISRMFGVEHFTFYMMSASEPVRSVLSYYVRRGVAEVYNWTLPLDARNYRYYGQVTCVQDCLFRNMRKSRYILFGDMDEIFTPRSTDQLLPLLDKHFKQQPKCGGFVFLNTFFDVRVKANYTKFPNSSYAKAHNMKMLLTAERGREIWIPGKRSKPAVIPTRVNVTHVHNVKSFRGDYKQCTMEPEEGLLHHYRKVPSGLTSSHQPSTSGYVLDPYLQTFSSEIVRRVHKVLTDLGNAVVNFEN